MYQRDDEKDEHGEDDQQDPEAPVVPADPEEQEAPEDLVVAKVVAHQDRHSCPLECRLVVATSHHHHLLEVETDNPTLHQFWICHPDWESCTVLILLH